MVQMNPKSTLQKPVGKVFIYDLQFVDGAKADKTLVFEMGQGEPPQGKPVATKETWTVYLDVDSQDVPVAISFVHHENAPIQYAQTASQEEAIEVVQQLYDFALELTRIRRVTEKFAKAHARSRRPQIRHSIDDQERNLSAKVAERMGGLAHYEQAGGRLALA